jgi:adenylate cyclase
MGATRWAMGLYFTYSLTLLGGVLLPDVAALAETAELLEVAERSGDDFTLACAQFVRGLTLVHHGGPQSGDGFALLIAARDAALQQRFVVIAATVVDIHLAKEKARAGDLDGAIELSRSALDEEIASGDSIFYGSATAVLVEALLRRGAEPDLHDAQGAVDRLAAVSTEPGFVMHDIWLLRLRALLARARGDEDAYRDYRDRYRAVAAELGFEGQMKWAEAMP